MTRTEARELLMQLLFQMEVQHDFSAEAKNKFFETNMKDRNQFEYMNNLYANVSNNLGEIDEKLEACSDNWKINRIPKVDLTILRLAICEILYSEDIPSQVAINEAVNLAKKYGSDESGKFINGVLGRVVKQYGI